MVCCRFFFFLRNVLLLKFFFVSPFHNTHAFFLSRTGMNVEQIDHLCMVAVNTTSTEERQQAEEALKTLKPNDFVAILSMSNCEISHFFAFSRLSWMIETEYLPPLQHHLFVFLFVKTHFISFPPSTCFTHTLKMGHHNRPAKSGD